MGKVHFSSVADLFEAKGRLLRDLLEGAGDVTAPVRIKIRPKLPSTQPAPPQGVTQPLSAPAAPPMLAAPPVMGEYPHSAPSLAQRTRPDHKVLAQRHQETFASFHHPDNRFVGAGNVHTSANKTFHFKGSDGSQYIVKPHDFVDPEQGETDKWHSRSDASVRALEAMGAGHMGVPSFTTTIPDKSRFDKVPDDSLHGRTAHVSHFAKGTTQLRNASQADLDKVSGEHRLVGLVHHVLFSNADGRHANVLLDREHGHPVLIDHDQALNSTLQRGFRTQPNNPSQVTGVMSVFAPGQDLDYRHGMITDPQTGIKRKMDAVGTDFAKHNPRMHAFLQWAAAGGHATSPEKGGFGLDPDDAAELQKNAQDLLKYGLEGTLERRYIIPTRSNRAGKQEHTADLRPAQQRPEEPGTRKIVLRSA